MRNIDLSTMSMNSDSYYRHPAKKFMFDDIEFDSTLEARWACAFAEACIEYEYNSRIVDLGRVFQDGKNSKKPDFYLPQVNMWAEVKPEPFADMHMGAKQWCNNPERMTSINSSMSANIVSSNSSGDRGKDCSLKIASPTTKISSPLIP